MDWNDPKSASAAKQQQQSLAASSLMHLCSLPRPGQLVVEEKQTSQDKEDHQQSRDTKESKDGKTRQHAEGGSAADVLDEDVFEFLK